MKTKANLLRGLLVLLAIAPNANALDQIVRPYQTVREDGMGGVKITTGEYDENFFGNPARVTDDPTWRLDLLDLQVETNAGALSNISTFTSSGSTLNKLSGSVGTNNHLRVETAMPAYYLGKTNDHRKFSVAIGLFTSIQADVDPRASYQVDPTVYVDVGPALSAGYKLLDDALSIGATVHAMYRGATNQTITFANAIKGGWSLSNTVGDGGMVDFDVGATYVFKNIKPLGFEIAAGASVDEVMNGQFDTIQLNLSNNNIGTPPNQPRAFNVGGSARSETLGPFTNFVFALEFQDIGNNANGSFFRTIHIGAETRWKTFLLRAGINQGYLCAGLGVDLKILRLELATYGEEMTLNSGGEEDRRYALRLALGI